MAWNAERAQARIARLQQEIPARTVMVEDFATEYLPRRAKLLAETSGSPGTRIGALPYKEAVLTNGVHVYVNLMDFADQLAESANETEANQRHALQFLHLHYGACDRLVDAFEIQRVDFHAARLHAVVLAPTGRESERERVVRAVALAYALREMIAENNRRFSGRFSTRVRIGIDTGEAVAINSGRHSEPDPLFIGNPANKAAHLAEGSTEGIFLSERALQVLRGGLLPGTAPEELLLTEGRRLYEAAGLARMSGGRTLQDAVSAAMAEYATELSARELAGEPASFAFHHQEPPLSRLDFKDLPPSNAVRMPMCAVFADLDGFTRYIAEAIRTGRLADAVANLHVIRGEFSAVIRDDFGGRKVRFIGDCLQGIIAEGNNTSIDSERSVSSAVMLAGALRSSFNLCRQLLPGIENLGLAIGIEYGWTPACRIGLRGESSVRCVTSRSTCNSEGEQGRCNGTETALGEVAYQNGSVAVRRTFGFQRVIPNLDYAAALAQLEGMPAPAIHVGQGEPVRAHSE